MREKLMARKHLQTCSEPPRRFPRKTKFSASLAKEKTQKRCKNFSINGSEVEKCSDRAAGIDPMHEQFGIENFQEEL